MCEASVTDADEGPLGPIPLCGDGVEGVDRLWWFLDEHVTCEECRAMFQHAANVGTGVGDGR